MGAPRGPGPTTVGAREPELLGACDSSFKAAHCRRLPTKQTVESVDAHFEVSSLLGGNALQAVFSKKTREIAPFEEKQPCVLHTVHISSLHAERSPMEWFHFSPSDEYKATGTAYRERNREYSLRESEVRTLIELGKFRVVPADDLARLGYRGDRSRMENDVQHLRHQGLIEQRSIEGHESYSKRVLTLTKEGHKLLSASQFYSRWTGDLSRLRQPQGSPPRRRSLPPLSQSCQRD